MGGGGEVEEVKPRYKGTILCRNCGAEFSKGTKWSSGHSTSTGTQTPNHIHEQTIAENQCPMCLTKEEEG